MDGDVATRRYVTDKSICFVTNYHLGSITAPPCVPKRGRRVGGYRNSVCVQIVVGDRYGGGSPPTLTRAEATRS